MLHTIGPIDYRRINNKLKYFQHWTFGSELVELLGWKPGDLIRPHMHELGMDFVPASINPTTLRYFPVVFYKLGTYRERSSLWLNYEITASGRKQFLTTLSNGVATKVCWRPHHAAFSAINSTLHLYGAGEPFRKGISRTKKNKR